MIILSQIKNEEYLDVKSILEKEGIEDELSQGIIYVLRERDMVMGVGKIAFEGDYWVLKYIVVKDECRGLNLGDSILKALLFKARSIEVQRVYYSGEEEYLIKKGFDYNNRDLIDTYKLIIDIEDFFDKPCCGDGNEI